MSAPRNRWWWRACCEKLVNKQPKTTNNNVPSIFSPRVQKCKYPVLRSSTKEPQFAYCTVCKSDFSIAGNIVRHNHESNKSETKAVRNNTALFSRCYHKDIRQWLHMLCPYLIWDIRVLLFFVCFLSGSSIFCSAADLNKNVCGNYCNACVHLLIQVLSNLLLLLILLLLSVSVLFTIVMDKEV